MTAAEAQEALAAVAVELDKARGILARIRDEGGEDWPEPMEAGEMTPSLDFRILADVETLLEDHIGPGLALARKASQLTEASVRRDWQADREAAAAVVDSEDDEARTVPDEAAGEAAAFLGGGEGMQKLCYVLFLARYDDGLALRLADMGAILNAGTILTKDGRTAATTKERLLLTKAARLESVLSQDEIDQYIVRRMDERCDAGPAEPPTAADLRAELFGSLASLSKAAQAAVALFGRVAELDLGLFDERSLAPIKDAVDELVRRVDVLRPPDDGPVGRALRIGRLGRPEVDDGGEGGE